MPVKQTESARLRRLGILLVAAGVSLACATFGLLWGYYEWDKARLLTADEIEACLEARHETWESLATCLCDHSNPGKRDNFEKYAESDVPKIKQRIAARRDSLTLNKHVGMRENDLSGVVKAYRVANDRPGAFGGGGPTHEWLILVDTRGRVVGWIGLGGAARSESKNGSEK